MAKAPQSSDNTPSLLNKALGFDDRFQYSLWILTVRARAVFHQTMMVKA